jgi:hypothetical protein
MDAAGPSRHATVTDEAEELALEAGHAPTANGAANGEAEEPEGGKASATLYLHNLNEKVQVKGGFCAGIR